jgi:hypothetical protein
MNGTPQKTGKIGWERDIQNKKIVSQNDAALRVRARRSCAKKAGKFIAGICGLKNGTPAKRRKRGGMDLQKKENLGQNERARGVRVKNGTREIWKHSG